MHERVFKGYDCFDKALKLFNEIYIITFVQLVMLSENTKLWKANMTEKWGKANYILRTNISCTHFV